MEGGMMSFVFFGAMFLIMYFFMIRPQMQRQKKEKKFREKKKKNPYMILSYKNENFPKLSFFIL